MSSVTTTISASQARNSFYTLLDEVANKLKRFIITRRGEAQVVLIHPEEVASWEETMDILANKKLIGQIIKSETERRVGKVISEEKVLAELGISPKDLE
jgi:prevent-host-death family protein